MSDLLGSNIAGASKSILDAHGISVDPHIPAGGTLVHMSLEDDMWAPSPTLLAAEADETMRRQSLESSQEMFQRAMYPVKHHIPDPSDQPRSYVNENGKTIFVADDGQEYFVFTSSFDDEEDSILKLLEKAGIVPSEADSAASAVEALFPCHP